MPTICVVGSGYVGLVTGACLADLGHAVTCIDVDDSKIRVLQQGFIPIYEPGLEDIVRRCTRAGCLQFTSSYAQGLRGAEFAFIAVNTPPGLGGKADMSYARAAVSSIAEHLPSCAIVVNKSTMPIGTGQWVAQVLARHDGLNAAVVSNPEFLREGSAVWDFQHPARIVIGADDRTAAERVAEIYRPLHAPIVITDLRTAEMIKYASNAFLATKISFINEIAEICEHLGADVVRVAEGMGLDQRIGRSFLNAGAGFGGSCFPKDVRALAYMATRIGCRPRLLQAVMEINCEARLKIVNKIRAALGTIDGRTIGVLGLAFKPETDDIREAPAVEIVRRLQAEGARVKAYDPAAMARAAAIMPGVELCRDAYEVADRADALVLLTEWQEFASLDLARLHTLMAQPIFVDGRNTYDPADMTDRGFTYLGVGRGHAQRDSRVDPLRAALTT